MKVSVWICCSETTRDKAGMLISRRHFGQQKLWGIGLSNHKQLAYIEYAQPMYDQTNAV